MIGFRVINPGLFTTFQDCGRLGYQQLGVPVSGVMDDVSHTIANLLVSKRGHEPVLEMTCLGAKIMFEKTMQIAITGGDMSAELNGHKIPMYETILVNSGDMLSFQGLLSGFRTYIAISDELILEEAFESYSTYVKAGFGGYEGRRLKSNDVVHVNERPLGKTWSYEREENIKKIRIMLSYEYEQFNHQTLFEKTYEVSKDSDRMGIRLMGAALQTTSHDIISSPISPGTIQIPASGQPIIMMRDAQTIGGYTRIGHILSCDMHHLAQLIPSDDIIFELMTIDEGKNLKIEWLNKLEQLKRKLVEVKPYIITINNQQYYVSVEERS